MCGRARLATDWSEIKIRLKFDVDAPAPNYERNYNLPPTGRMLTAVRDDAGRRMPRMMRWGLLPHWARDEKIGYSTFNARSEDFVAKPAFRDAWRRGQRCLIITDGFYEWKKLDAGGKRKQAYAIGPATPDTSMIMAGLWSNWRKPVEEGQPPGEEIVSCTILTCAPNPVMTELHNRMPVILGESDWPHWLGEEKAQPDALLGLLRPCPDDWLKVWAVDNKVGNVREKGPELVDPI